MALTTISGEIQAQPLNDNFSYLDQKFNGIALNVADYNATGDGVTYDSASIQNTVNAFPSAGGTMIIPRGQSGIYLLSADITFGGKQIKVIIDPTVVFTGTGNMPDTVLNANHEVIHDYYLIRPSAGITGHGDSTISAEIAPGNSYVGNAVAGFFGAKSGTGSGSIWALNPIARTDSGFTGFCNVVEIDLDTFSTAAASATALLITGLGTSNPDLGINVERADATVWGAGINVATSQTGYKASDCNIYGVHITGSTAATHGLLIENIAKDLIRLTPSNDTNPTNSIMYTTNAANSVINFLITKQGGIQIGPSGTEITKHISTTSGVIDFGSIAAQTTAAIDVAVSGAAVGDTVVVTPFGGLSGGIMYNALISASNTVAIRLANITAGPIDPDGAGLNWRIDIWKH